MSEQMSSVEGRDPRELEASFLVGVSALRQQLLEIGETAARLVEYLESGSDPQGEWGAFVTSLEDVDRNVETISNERRALAEILLEGGAVDTEALQMVMRLQRSHLAGNIGE